MSSEFGSEFKEFIGLLRRSKDYLLAHHPSCDKFEEDCYHIGEKRLCVGCFTAYPTALMIIVIWLFGLIDISIGWKFLIGTFFGSLQFFSLTRISDFKFGKIVIKVFLGLGIGFFTIAIFSIPVHILVRIFLFIGCINIAGFFSFLRMKKIENICDSCEYNREWSNCPGFELAEEEDQNT